MALKLYFVPKKLPRTWTKKQWKEAYRWVRLTEKILDAQMEAQREKIARIQTDTMLYGIAWYTIKDGLIENLINPPLLMGPGMEP
jgi:hypothetical protein